MAKIVRHGSRHQCDWCHICGERKTETADVWFPDNAEHGQEDTRYIRICGDCAHRISEVAKGQNQYPDTALSML